MSLLGPCPECGEELGADQRYCANCGHAVATPLVPTYKPVAPREEMARTGGWPFPIPVSMAGTFAAAALAFGVLISTAIDPNLSSLVAGGRLNEELQAGSDQGAEQPADGAKKGKGKKGGSGSSGLGTGSTTFDTGTGFYGTTGSFGYDFAGSTGSGGGGSGNGTGGVSPPKKKPKPKPIYLTGTVVHKNPFAVSYTISSGGGISAIHTKTADTLPNIGATVKTPVRKLANGTYAESGERQITGSATSATFSGVVTDRQTAPVIGDPSVYTVSGRGASIMVYAPATGPALPALKDLVTTTVTIQDFVPMTLPQQSTVGACAAAPPPPIAFPASPLAVGKQLVQTSHTVATTVQTTDIETLVQKSCTSPAAVVVSTDDIREAQTDREYTAGPAVNPASLVNGNVIVASIDMSTDPFTMTATASDQAITGADTRSRSLARIDRVRERNERRIARAISRLFD